MEIIYHYTSAEGLYGILREKKLRMTDVRYLNDSSELVYGLELIRERLKMEFENKDNGLSKLLGGTLADNSLNEYSAWKQAVALVEEKLDDTIERGANFCASFSMDDNNLRQWMSYCPDGGYAIGFVKNNLEKTSDRLIVREVNYTEKHSSEKSIISQFQEICKNYAKDLEKREFNPKTTCKGIESLRLDGAFGHFYNEISTLMSTAISASLFEKKSDFHDEKEVRIIRDSIFSELMSGITLPLDEIEFYNKGNLLIPFIPLKFDTNDIKHIVIGPMKNQYLAKKSLDLFCRMHQYILKIDVSEIPLRTF